MLAEATLLWSCAGSGEGRELISHAFPAAYHGISLLTKAWCCLARRTFPTGAAGAGRVAAARFARSSAALLEKKFFPNLRADYRTQTGSALIDVAPGRLVEIDEHLTSAF